MSENLREAIFPLSTPAVLGNWKACCKEWEFVETWKEEGAHCICGVCICDNILIRNKITRAEAVVGNICIKQFTNKELHAAIEEEEKRDELARWYREPKEVFCIFHSQDLYGRLKFRLKSNNRLIELLRMVPSYQSFLFQYQSSGADKYLITVKNDGRVYQRKRNYVLPLRLNHWEFRGKRGVNIVIDNRVY